MSLVLWPSTLPQSPNPAGYRVQEQDMVRRFQPDYGPPKTRPRVSEGIDQYAITLTFLTKPQVLTLDSFFRNTLLQGTEPFAWVDHRTAVDQDYRFLGSPSYTTTDGGHLWNATFSLEKWIENPWIHCTGIYVEPLLVEFLIPDEVPSLECAEGTLFIDVGADNFGDLFNTIIDLDNQQVVQWASEGAEAAMYIYNPIDEVFIFRIKLTEHDHFARSYGAGFSSTNSTMDRYSLFHTTTSACFVEFFDVTGVSTGTGTAYPGIEVFAENCIECLNWVVYGIKPYSGAGTITCSAISKSDVGTLIAIPQDDFPAGHTLWRAKVGIPDESYFLQEWRNDSTQEVFWGIYTPNVSGGIAGPAYGTGLIGRDNRGGAYDGTNVWALYTDFTYLRLLKLSKTGEVEKDFTLGARGASSVTDVWNTLEYDPINNLISILFSWEQDSPVPFIQFLDLANNNIYTKERVYRDMTAAFYPELCAVFSIDNSPNQMAEVCTLCPEKVQSESNFIAIDWKIYNAKDFTYTIELARDVSINTFTDMDASGDGNYLVICAYDNGAAAPPGFVQDILVYDTSTWNEIPAATPVQDQAVACRFSRDSSKLAVSEAWWDQVAPTQDRLHIIDTSTWTGIMVLDGPGIFNTIPKALAWSPDGSMLAAGAGYIDGGATAYLFTVFDTTSWLKVDTNNSTPASVQDLDFSPDGQYLAVCYSSNNVKIVDVSTWLTIAEVNMPDNGKATSVRFNADGSRIVVGLDEHPYVSLIDTSDWSYIQGWMTTGDGPCNGAAFDKTGLLYATANEDDYRIHVFNTEYQSSAAAFDMATLPSPDPLKIVFG